MPKNLIALLRYETIDKCLRNTGRRYSFQDLRMAVAEALKEKMGKDDIPSVRTIQSDLKNMKSGILGYDAPIKNKREGKGAGYYVYTDPDFSIKNYSLDDDEVRALYKSLDILQHFSEFDFQKKAMKAIKKLMKEICPNLNNNELPIIGFSRVKEADGWKLIDKIYHAIEEQQVLSFEFHPFRSKESVQVFQEVHPYYLHEYNNRWFLFALCKNENEEYAICKFGLERLYNIEHVDTKYIPNKKFNPENYFSNKLGVSQGQEDNPIAEDVILAFSKDKGRYVKSKPIHPSQEIIYENKEEIGIKIKVIINYELIREVISFMDEVKVMSPPRLQNKVKEILQTGLDLYDIGLPMVLNETRIKLPFSTYGKHNSTKAPLPPGPGKNSFQQLKKYNPPTDMFEKIRQEVNRRNKNKGDEDFIF